MVGFVAVRSFLLILAMMTLSCVAMPVNVPSQDKLAQIEKGVEELAFEMSNRAREFDLVGKTVAVTTFVDMDNLEQTSSFGRFISESLATELFKLGFNVRELRQRMELMISPKRGEFSLSRKSELLAKKFSVDAVVAGTYTVVDNKVVVHARILSLDTSRFVSVGRLAVDMGINDEVRRLLDRETREPSSVVHVISNKRGEI